MTAVSALSQTQFQQEIDKLNAVIQQHENTIKHQQSSIQNLQHQLHLFRTARFGRKSEKIAPQEQLSLFDEAQFSDELPAVPEVEQTQTITYTRSKKGTGRKPLPKSLPYVEKVYDLNDNEKKCACGCELTHIDDEITEQLDIVPQMTFRVVHIRKKYACKFCEETIQLAKLPKQPLDKAEAMFGEAGISVTRGTLSNWIIKSAKLLTPLVKLLIDNILNYDIAYADETPLQILKEKGRLPTQKSYMWLFIGGPPDKRAFVYQYHPTRSHNIPSDFFADFKGYLHADCYLAEGTRTISK